VGGEETIVVWIGKYSWLEDEGTYVTKIWLVGSKG